MAVYDSINIESLVKECYGKDSKEYETIINNINKYGNTFCTSEINDYFEEIKKYPILSVEEQQKYIDEYLNGNKEAKQNLINSKLYYVFLVALGYIGNGINLEDLIQEGNIGLITAVNSLNNSNRNNFAFQTNCYVNLYISNFIEKYNKKQTDKYMNSRQSVRMLKYYQKKLLDNASIEDICDELDIVNKEITKSFDNNISLDSKLNDEITVKDAIYDDLYNFETIVTKDENELLPIINNSDLTKKQKKYVIVRFGLLDNNLKSKRATAKLFNISPEAINCLHKSAVKKLKLNNQIIELYHKFYHNTKIYEQLKETKKLNDIDKKRLYLSNKERLWLNIKKNMYTFFPNHSKKEIDDVLFKLSKEDSKIIEEIFSEKDINLKQDFLNILDKLSNILDKGDYSNIKKEKQVEMIFNDNSISKIKEKSNIVCNTIDVLSNLNNLTQNPSKKKEYLVNIKYKTDNNENIYSYNIMIMEKVVNKINILLNINFKFKNHQDGLKIIKDIIKKVNENSQIVLPTFDKNGNSVIVNDSGIKFITQINDLEGNNEFITLHKLLKENVKKNKTKIKRIEKK